MEDVRGFDDSSTSHRYLAFVQLRMMNNERLAVVDVHVKADSMAAAFSS